MVRLSFHAPGALYSGHIRFEYDDSDEEIAESEVMATLEVGHLMGM